jgi:thymidylate kinase
VLINIRGTFGSGKSTIVRNVLGEIIAHEVMAVTHVEKPTRADPQRLQRRELVGAVGQGGRVIALGEYRATCGGADEFSWKGAHDAICDAIVTGAHSDRPVVLFEGVTISGIHVRYRDLAADLYKKTGRTTHKVFVMPDVEECVRRVAARSGRGATDKIRETVTDKWHSVCRVHQKLLLDNVPGIRLYWSGSSEQAEALVRELIEENT